MPQASRSTTTIHTGAGTVGGGDEPSPASGEAAAAALSAPAVIVGLKDGLHQSAARAPQPFYIQAIELLSFVKTRPRKGAGRIWWAVPDIDEAYAEQLGEGMGLEFLRHTRRWERDGSGTILCGVIEDMVKAGRFGTVERAFVRVLAQALIGRVGL